ncbi:hypothetical protein Prudu_012564 [Prunus dulcis]|uniref:Uncharacterized protein n=1 Tax=Prunus dulcis TaxID=3755 RepID=A0A4Y1RCY8_PRUDU|nr:hypothetical protein Prudu_012564 [Prunus dulcis]
MVGLTDFQLRFWPVLGLRFRPLPKSWPEMLRFSGEALSLWTPTRCPRVWQRVGTVAEDRAIVSDPTVRSEPNLQDECPKCYRTHRNFRIGIWRSVQQSLECQLECYMHYFKYLPGFWMYYEYHQVKVSRGVGYPALRQTPYVALVVPAYGEICDSMAWSHVA